MNTVETESVLARAEARGGGPVGHARLSFLDALRGIAAVVVVVQHFGIVLHARYNDYFDLGRFGVVLFFLCSGFVIPSSLERAGNLRRFWWGRVFRLYPLYWASLGGAVLLGALGKLPLDDAYVRMPVMATLANATMLQRFIAFPDAIVVYWTLAYEMLFYGLVSLLFFARLTRRLVFVTGCLLIAGLLAGVVLPPLAGFPGNPTLTMSILLMATLLMGSVIARALAGKTSRASLLALAAIIALTLAGVLLAGGSEGAAKEVRLHCAAYVAAWGVFGLFLGLRRRHFPRALTELGTISYSLYLVHPLVVSAIPNIWGVAQTAILWTATLFLAAVATYRWIERPGIALGRKMQRGGRISDAVAPAIDLPDVPPAEGGVTRAA